MFAVFAKMVNLWLRTMDSMNSEEHSEVFVDANDQRDWPVADDSVETTLGTLSDLSGENTRLGATPHTSSVSVSPSLNTPPSQLLALSSSDRSQTVSPIRLASPSPVTPARPDASH